MNDKEMEQEKQRTQVWLDQYREHGAKRDEAFTLLIEALTVYPAARQALQKWHDLNWESCVESSEMFRCCLTEVLDEFPAEPEPETVFLKSD